MRMMTPREAAAALSGYGLSAGQIKRAARAGRFPYIMVGSHMLVDCDAAQAILEAERRAARLISTGQLAEATGLSLTAIRRGVAEGWLPARGGDGRHLRFDLDEVQAALRRVMTENQENANKT